MRKRTRRTVIHPKLKGLLGGIGFNFRTKRFKWQKAVKARRRK